MIHNKIYNGDCRELITKVKDESVDLVILDAPYLTTKEAWDQLEVISPSFISDCYRVLKSTGSIYVFCGIGEKSNSLMRWHPLFNDIFHFKQLITWKKIRGMGMMRGWMFTREEIMWFVKDNKQFIWNKEHQYTDEERPWHMKKDGKMVNKSKFKRITNVWTDIPECGFGTSPQKFSEKRFHFSPKPIKLIERIIKAHTQRGDLVLDCFAGSGITGIACQNLEREFILFEQNEDYCDMIKQRLDI